jgi:geranyl-CoA carboxylase alpha subunit
MAATPFTKILIANRSEIAVRIIRTARRLAYRTVAVYSDADVQAVHTHAADESVYIGASPSADSYLNIARIVEAARRSGADAVHPGYGFLSENPAFARACRDAGLVFIGPSPEAIAAMGDKATAKRLMQEHGLPCIPGYQGDDQSDAALLEQARRIGFPVMIKAVAGGGGRGIRRVQDANEFLPALRSARSEAQAAFGDSRVLLEKAIISPRHVEVQVFADRHGNAIHLGERDCSVQRRHQKLVEEAPSPAVDAAQRETIGSAAARAAVAIGYEGAGTIEYLLDASGQFYFMEMNTRLQVEHPVTEAITGLDLVELQLRVAAGEPLPLRQDQVRFSGHALEVRLCSEDPTQSFAPQSGRMLRWTPYAGVRVDHALESGSDIPTYYDSMIAKVIAHGASRDQARRQLIVALEDFVALGPATNQDFLIRCLRHPVFAAGDATTDFIDDQALALLGVPAGAAPLRAAVAAALLQYSSASTQPEAAPRAGLMPRVPLTLLYELDGQAVSVELTAPAPDHYRIALAGDVFELALQRLDETTVLITHDGYRRRAAYVRSAGSVLFAFAGGVHRIQDRRLAAAKHSAGDHDGRIRAQMTGRVVAIHAPAGTRVSVGQPVLTIEAMKMELTHCAPRSGILTQLLVELNAQVTQHRVVAQVEEPGAEAGGNAVPQEAS